MRVFPFLFTGLVLLASCSTQSASSEPAGEAPSATTVVSAVEPAAAETAPPGDAGAWPADQVEAFVDACTAQADAELCGCAADVLQTEIDFDELLASAGEAMSAASLPPDLLTIVVENCL
ncbi:MAG: hypothetical protein AAGD18_15460 [Actinomycetota bacterium]